MQNGDVRIMAQSNLRTARNSKKDEFYTRIPEIQAEIKNYKDQFVGKVVFCNCDDPFICKILCSVKKEARSNRPSLSFVRSGAQHKADPIPT